LRGGDDGSGMDEELISRSELEGLLFNVGDLVVLMSLVVELLGGDLGEEEQEG
jgi:hypothetical protein